MVEDDTLTKNKYDQMKHKSNEELIEVWRMSNIIQKDLQVVKQLLLERNIILSSHKNESQKEQQNEGIVTPNPLLKNKQEVKNNIVYAGFMKRLLACLID